MNAPCIWDRYRGCWPTVPLSNESEQGRVSVPCAGLAAVPLPWPVVVVPVVVVRV